MLASLSFWLVPIVCEYFLLSDTRCSRPILYFAAISQLVLQGAWFLLVENEI